MGVKASSYSDRHLGGDERRKIGDGMRVRHGSKALTAAALLGTMLAGALVTTSGGAAGAATSSAPGVTSNSITVGTISTQTGTLSANFSSLIYGERAYYDYINAQGGVNGRKINYKYALDDGGNPTTFNQLANTLINQDHVFAVTGVATAFFSPNLFVESSIPTYGYNVTGNWQGPKNLFAAGGSVQYYHGRGAPGRLRGAARRRSRLRSRSSPMAWPPQPPRARPNRLTDGRGVQGELLRPQGQLPGLHRGHRRAAHEAGRREHGRELHGRPGQRHDGPGHQAVRAEQHDAAVVQRERPVDARHEPEPDAGRVLRHRTRARSRRPRPSTRVSSCTSPR